MAVLVANYPVWWRIRETLYPFIYLIRSNCFIIALPPTDKKQKMTLLQSQWQLGLIPFIDICLILTQKVQQFLYEADTTNVSFQ